MNSQNQTCGKKREENVSESFFRSFSCPTRFPALAVLCSLLALGREQVEDRIEDLLRLLKALGLGIDISKGVLRFHDRGPIRAPVLFLVRGDDAGHPAVRRANC